MLRILLGALLAGAMPASAQDVNAATPAAQSCFLLFDMEGGEVMRDPAEACALPLSPGATFEIPLALAALSSGVVKTVDQPVAFDGQGQWPESARRDHSLASGMQHSVTWYFQRLAQGLGRERQRMYLQVLDYGNKDSGSNPVSFWMGGSLQVTPEQQQDFMVRLFTANLDLSRDSVMAVRALLRQPAGVVITAAGEQAFAKPWPADAVLSAKAGSTRDRSGRAVRWLVGHIARDGKAYVFVSCVVGLAALPENAAIDLAARSLKAAEVL